MISLFFKEVGVSPEGFYLPLAPVQKYSQFPVISMFSNGAKFNWSDFQIIRLFENRADVFFWACQIMTLIKNGSDRFSTFGGKIWHMAKKTFFLKLNPPRPSFTLDITEEERAIMAKHIEYWKPHIHSGTAVVIGMVADPKGGYGVGVVQVDDEHQLNELIANDPANGLHSYEVHPIRAMSRLING